METTEVAKGLVEMCRQGQFAEAIEAYYGEHIVSVEGNGEATAGLDAVRGKSQWFMENHEVHGAVVEGPFVAANEFAVRFTLDVTFKPSGERSTMSEVALYTVTDGKIVNEKFLYLAG